MHWIIFAISSLIFIYFLLPNHIRRAITYFYPNIDDYKKFNNREIKADNPKEWENHELYNTVHIGTESNATYMLDQDIEIPSNYKKLLESYETVSYLIINNNKLFFEEYYDGYDEKTISNSFSMAKGIVSLLIGIALDEGLIESLDQPVSDFIPEFEISTFGVTIYHLLTMTSGLDWSESESSINSDNTKSYYGTDLRGLLKNISIKYVPGEVHDYTSGTTQLLVFILEKATGKKISDYATDKLWSKLECTDNALWTLDKENGDEKGFCCFNSNSRNFARLGQLILNKGKWNGVQVVSEEYINMMTTPISEDTDIKDIDGKSVHYYGFQIWFTTFKGKLIPYYRGIQGQYIFIIPNDTNEGTVVVRLGNKRSDERIDNTPPDVFIYLELAKEMLESNGLIW